MRQSLCQTGGRLTFTRDLTSAGVCSSSMIEYSWVNQVLPSSIFGIRWTAVKVPGQSKLMKVTSATNRNSGFPKENCPARRIASVPWGGLGKSALKLVFY